MLQAPAEALLQIEHDICFELIFCIVECESGVDVNVHEAASKQVLVRHRACIVLVSARQEGWEHPIEWICLHFKVETGPGSSHTRYRLFEE